MIDNKITEKVNSQFISPIVEVKKSNGEIWLSLDARNINKFTKSEYERPMNPEYRFRIVPYGLQISYAGLVRALHAILDK